MCYSSRIGCVLYFDDVVGDLLLCEPTLLFLLGLDAVTTPSSEYILHIPVIDSKTGKQAIDEETGEPIFEDEPNKYLLKNLVIHKDIVGEEIFNKIIYALKFSYSIIQLTDNQVDFDLKGLKLFMNNITGTNEDRIVPFIFHEHKNEFILGPIDEDNKYNCIADKMQKVFSYAGYDVGDNEVRLVGKSFITDEATIDSINEYNKDVLAEHEDKKFYRHIYKILDYKSMYSYALGVLFGCKCLGFSDNDIFRSDPTDWYDGEFVNLVSLASRVFKFHYTHSIPKIDVDPCLYRKYRDIQVNKIWNFDNDVVQLKQDEKNCTVLYIDDNEVVESHIVYSKSTGPQKPIPGSYLLDDSTWQPLDELVISSSDPKKGTIHNCDRPAIRYIAHNAVEIKQAYKYAKNKYLSPTNELISFISDGNIGWVAFDYEAYRNEPSDEYAPLTFSEKDFEDLPSTRFNNAISKETGAVVGYYKSDIANEIHLYGIMSNKINKVIIEEDEQSEYDNADDTTEDEIEETYTWDFSDVEILFTSLLSDIDFYNNYYTILPDGYTVTNYYDLDKPIALCINDENPDCYYNGSEDIPLIEKGYTLTPSIALDAYKYDYETNTVNPFDLRFNSDMSSYWSAEWDPKEWSEVFDKDAYINTGNTISLYRNIECLFEDAPTYSGQFDKSDLICNITCELYDLYLGFLRIDELYYLGITPYECEIVETDPNGDPLVDEHGNFVVWYDSNTLRYWNGYVSSWQDSIPVRNNNVMYNTYTKLASSISDNEIDHEITLEDGTVMSYEEFYAYPYHYGVIRDRTSFKLFNPNISNSILQCYYDDVFDDGGRYCVPDIFDRWMTFNEVHDAGYWFVSNESTLYNGDSLVPVIVDNDPTD